MRDCGPSRPVSSVLLMDFGGPRGQSASLKDTRFDFALVSHFFFSSSPSEADPLIGSKGSTAVWYFRWPVHTIVSPYVVR